ncbi:hypothetical protein BDA96_03G242900 [Sorghum bicolor]|uniref:Uncharacterized protein n=1 Tax=Sorghum bicolor TaxID=4558 RepID=A0A921RFB5_SORBI|nr:hypothetical protein BDA96_03G242900 [Sorghum bicolor]
MLLPSVVGLSVEKIFYFFLFINSTRSRLVFHLILFFWFFQILFSNSASI